MRSTSHSPRSSPISRRPRPPHEDHGGTARGTDAGGAIDYGALCSVDVKRAGPLPLREAYFRWFAPKPRPIAADTFATVLEDDQVSRPWTLSAEERTAREANPRCPAARRLPIDLLAARKPVKEWALAELVPAVERDAPASADLERAAGSCTAEPRLCRCSRFEGGGRRPRPFRSRRPVRGPLTCSKRSSSRAR